MTSPLGSIFPLSPPVPPTSWPGHWPALDVVKALGVGGMILVHSFYWVATVYGKVVLPADSWVAVWLSRLMFVGFFSLMLPMTSGCVFRFQLSPSSDLPRLSLRQCAPIWKRSILLSLIGFAMNAAAVGWEGFWGWNVLQFVGLSLGTIATLLVFLPIHSIGVAGVLVLLCQPLVLSSGLSTGESYFCHALFGDPSGFHGWPFFPWFATVAFGFILGHLRIVWRERSRFERLLAILGGTCMVVAMATGDWLPPLDPESLMGGKLFSPPPGTIIAVLGLASLLFLAAEHFAEAYPLHPHGIINSFSKGILWIYVFHLTVGCRLDSFLRTVTGSPAWLTALGPVGKTVAVLGFPIGLLGSSWLLGNGVVRFLHESRLRLHLRKVR